MKLLLDTNRYRDFCAADPLTKEILQQAGVIKERPFQRTTSGSRRWQFSTASCFFPAITTSLIWHKLPASDPNSGLTSTTELSQFLATNPVINAVPAAVMLPCPAAIRLQDDGCHDGDAAATDGGAIMAGS